MSAPIRFCMVTTFFPPRHFGGAGIYAYRLASALAERGHDVHVIYCRDAYELFRTETAKEEDYPLHENITVHALSSAAGPMSPLLTQQTGRPLLKSAKIDAILERHEFDVIHFHNVSLIGGPSILEHGDALKLYTLHDYWLVCPTHVLFKNGRTACRKPTCLSCTLRHHRPPQIWRYTGLVQRKTEHVDAFLAPSTFVADMHRSRGLDIPTISLPMFVPEPRTAKPYHADSQEDAREDVNSDIPGEAGDRPYFLFVGRLERLKGLQDVIPVFERFAEANLVIVGDGSYRAELERIAGNNSRVQFLGALPYERIQPLYEGALALVVPSICYETFGLTVLESFSMKTPVIARDIGALREIVSESGGGLLFSSGEELLERLNTFIRDPDVRKRISDRAYARYLESGTPEYHVQKYLGIVNCLRKTADAESVPDIG